jgi:hypothetical protein
MMQGLLLFLRVGGMGMLPVDICVVSNVKVYGYYISGGYVQIECVVTCLSGRRCWRRAVGEVWFFSLWKYPLLR